MAMNCDPDQVASNQEQEPSSTIDPNSDNEEDDEEEMEETKKEDEEDEEDESEEEEDEDEDDLGEDDLRSLGVFTSRGFIDFRRRSSFLPPPSNGDESQVFPPPPRRESEVILPPPLSERMSFRGLPRPPSLQSISDELYGGGKTRVKRSVIGKLNKYYAPALERRSVGVSWLYRMIRKIKEKEEKSPQDDPKVVPVLWLNHREQYLDATLEADYDYRDIGNNKTELMSPTEAIADETMKNKSLGEKLTLQEVLDDYDRRECLRQFLEANYCDENIKFLEAVEEFDELAESNEDGINDMLLVIAANDIFNDFVAANAVNQVNFSGDVTHVATAQIRQLNLSTADLDIHMFEQAKAEVLKMVSDDVFSRFLQSTEYDQMEASHVGFDKGGVMDGQDVMGLQGAGWVAAKGPFVYTHIFVQVHSARNLSPEFSHFYCTITVDSKEHKTDVVHRSKRKPKPSWKQGAAAFPILTTTQSVEVKLNATRLLEKGVEVGRVVIPVQLIGHIGRPLWMPFTNTPKKDGKDDNKPKRKNTRVTTDGDEPSSADKPDDNLGELLLKVELRTDKDEIAVSQKRNKKWNILRVQNVKKKRQFFKADGFNIDLSYITDRIIAMGFPGGGGMFHNHRQEVKKFFEKRHRGAFMIYNLCCDEASGTYDPADFDGNVTRMPMDLHHLSFATLRHFCNSVQAWLERHPQHVVAVHCKSGVRVTAVLICAYLLHSGLVQGTTDTDEKKFEEGAKEESGLVDEAITFFSDKRLKNNKKAVRNPSLIRYINYYTSYLTQRATLDGVVAKVVYLRSIRMTCLPPLLRSKGTSVWMTIYNRDLEISSQGVFKSTLSQDERGNAVLDMHAAEKAMAIANDVKLSFFVNTLTGNKRLFELCFHVHFEFTASGSENVVAERSGAESGIRRASFLKKDLEKAYKDTRYADDFRVELIVQRNKIETPKKVDKITPQDTGKPSPSRKNESMMEMLAAKSHKHKNKKECDSTRNRSKTTLAIMGKDSTRLYVPFRRARAGRHTLDMRHEGDELAALCRTTMEEEMDASPLSGLSFDSSDTASPRSSSTSESRSAVVRSNSNKNKLNSRSSI